VALDLAFFEVDHVFGDVDRVVGDPLEHSGDREQVDHLREKAWGSIQGLMHPLEGLAVHLVDPIVRQTNRPSGPLSRNGR